MIRPKYYLIHSVFDPQPDKILKILHDDYLFSSSYSKYYGLYNGFPLDYVYFSLLGETLPFHSGINFILDTKVLYKRSFRYALKWIGNDIEDTIKVNYQFDDVDNILDEINQHIISVASSEPGRKMTSHEILLRKKVSLHRYLVAIGGIDMLSIDAINYIKQFYPHVKLLDELPESANELNDL